MEDRKKCAHHSHNAVKKRNSNRVAVAIDAIYVMEDRKKCAHHSHNAVKKRNSNRVAVAIDAINIMEGMSVDLTRRKIRVPSI
jgi:hypothetical protein